MPSMEITINTRRPFGGVRGGRRTPLELENWLGKCLSGEVQCDSIIFSRQDTTAYGDLATAGQAVGALVLSAGAGTVGASIDGSAVTVVWATSDVASMTALCAAIRALATINRKVTAANRVAQMTLASVLAGTTVQVFGITFTAQTGAPTAFNQFDRTGTDTAAATSLALAINRHPSLSGVCRAVSNAGIVYVGLLEDRPARGAGGSGGSGQDQITLASAATISVGVPVPIASAIGLVFAFVPGHIGECVTVVPSGTGMTYATANAGKLGGSTGGGMAPSAQPNLGTANTLAPIIVVP